MLYTCIDIADLAATVDGDNVVKRIYSTSSQRLVSTIYTATAPVQLEHLKHNILVLRLTVGVFSWDNEICHGFILIVLDW